MEQLPYPLDGFSWNLISQDISKKNLPRNFKFFLAYNPNGCFTWRLCTFMIVALWILLEWEMFQTKVKVIPQQAEVAQGFPRRLRPRIFLTFGTTRVVGRRPYAPAAFAPGEMPGTHFQRLSWPQGTWFHCGPRFQTKVRENQNTSMFNKFPHPPRKSYRLWDNAEKYGRGIQATDGNVIWRMRFACWITKAKKNTHTQNM